MPRTSTPTFREFSNEFMTLVAANEFSPGHQANYRSYLSKWLLPAFGDLHLSSVTAPAVHKFLLGITPQVGPVGKAKVYHALQRLMAEAVQFGYIKEWTYKAKGVGGDKSADQPDWTVEQVEKVIMFLPPYLQPVARVTLGSALRIGEACGLNMGDWDATNRAVNIQRQYTGAALVPPKLGSTGLVYPILGAGAILDETTANRPAWGQPSDAMFRGVRGARLSPDVLRMEWMKARGETFKGMHFHHLRRVGLSMYARIPGVTIGEIQAHGRHSDVSSALRYQQKSDDDRRRALSEGADEA